MNKILITYKLVDSKVIILFYYIKHLVLRRKEVINAIFLSENEIGGMEHILIQNWKNVKILKDRFKIYEIK
jgi:hypothetical protein